MRENIRENQDKLKALIQEIASRAAEALPENWVHVGIGCFLVGENRNDTVQVVAELKDSEGFYDLVREAWENMDLDDALVDIQKAFRKLHALCQAAGDNWQEATISLYRNGTFKTDFAYEPIHEFDSYYIEDWKSRYMV